MAAAVLSQNCGEILGAALKHAGEHGRILIRVGHAEDVLLYRGGADSFGNHL
jgi:hypothetical protein